MCDAFRNSCEYQFMTGGQWVAHPGNDKVNYTVEIRDRAHPITKGVRDFVITDEQHAVIQDEEAEVARRMTGSPDHS